MNTTYYKNYTLNFDAETQRTTIESDTTTMVIQGGLDKALEFLRRQEIDSDVPLWRPDELT